MAIEERTLTLQFAEKIAEATPSNSHEAILAAKKGLIDFLASCYAGRYDSGIKKLLAIIDAEGGRSLAPVIGQGFFANKSQAAFINGFIGHVLDYDDVHSDVRGHPSVVILPTLLSLAADTQVTGRRFLEAYIIGVEVMARLGTAIGDLHYVKGWHNTSTLGAIAATCAGGFLLNFSAEELAVAIGFAATQASGLRNQFGTETKPLHAGLAAKSAVLAIELTASGFRGTGQALDGKLGFLAVYGKSDKDCTSALLNDWGRSWRIVTPGMWFKLYPFCSAAYHGADAAIELSPLIINKREIEKIRVIFPPNGDAALIQSQPITGEQGRFSVEYVVALALLGKPFDFSYFKEDYKIPQEMLYIMSLIERRYNKEIEPAANAVPSGRFTILEVDMIDGKRYQSRVDAPKGSPNNPLELYQLEEKLYKSVEDNLLSKQLLQVIGELEDINDVHHLIHLL